MITLNEKILPHLTGRSSTLFDIKPQTNREYPPQGYEGANYIYIFKVCSCICLYFRVDEFNDKVLYSYKGRT